jgi:hypothetical protein
MQDTIAILIVFAAALFLARRAWLRLARRTAGGCGSCGNCSSSDVVNSRQLVSIAVDFSHATSQSRK